MPTPDYEQILQSSNHGVIATNEKGKIVFINNRAKTILHFGKRKIVGSNISNLLPITAELVIDCLNSGNSQLGSQIVGKRFSLVVNINAIRNRQKIVGAVCNFLTMEEFEASARNLESFDFLDKQFKTVFESSSDGLWICDREGKVVNINRASEKLGAIKKQLEEIRKQREKYRDELTELSMLELKNQKIVAESEQMKQIMKTALKLAHMEVNGILLLGESGTFNDSQKTGTAEL